MIFLIKNDIFFKKNNLFFIKNNVFFIFIEKKYVFIRKIQKYNTNIFKKNHITISTSTGPLYSNFSTALSLAKLLSPDPYNIS